ncbi:MAG: Clp1/GlmU family protein [Candidatus Bathyarchaeota archaeon]|nr:Clp1/GlmU family protein [Candidatus Bathyarchaeota archaeon]MDH5701489.1 Clp1/GlmU family protein [Candidatus Bathyarchaeota archaeon]
MNHIVKTGKTLLVDGPASVSLLSGRISVLGAPFMVGEKIIIRDGKRVPFGVRKKATFDLMLGEGASFEEIDGGTVPPSWENAAKEVLSLKKPVTVMVMGGVDSGKTSFCTFLANEALRKKWKTGIIDADLGQSDVGPPSTVGFNFVSEPVKDLFEIKAENAYFVGLTSPSGAVNKIMKGLTELKNRAMEADVDFLIVNTDGWVDGEEAVKYKIQLTKTVSPSVIVGIRQEDELTPILTALKEAKVLSIDSPQLVQRRNREKRKILRELSYKKYLKQAKVQSFALNWVKVEDSLLGAGGPLAPERMEKIRNLLGKRPIYSEETLATIFVVLRKNQSVTEEQMKEIEESFGKRAKVIREGEEEGLLVGLQDERGKFLGIGILCGVDYRRRVMKVYTPINENVSTIRFGQIKLDENGREIGLSTIYSNYLM